MKYAKGRHGPASGWCSASLVSPLAKTSEVDVRKDEMDIQWFGKLYEYMPPCLLLLLKSIHSACRTTARIWIRLYRKTLFRSKLISSSIILPTSVEETEIKCDSE